MMQYNSIAKHLCGAISCLYDEWSENSCEIVSWNGASIEEITQKIKRLKKLEAKLKIVIRAANSVVYDGDIGESQSDIDGLTKSLAEVEASLLQDLLTGIEMLEAFAEFRSRPAKPIYDADDDIPF